MCQHTPAVPPGFPSVAPKHTQLPAAQDGRPHHPAQLLNSKILATSPYPTCNPNTGAVACCSAPLSPACPPKGPAAGGAAGGGLPNRLAAVTPASPSNSLLPPLLPPAAAGDCCRMGGLPALPKPAGEPKAGCAAAPNGRAPAVPHSPRDHVMHSLDLFTQLHK